MTALQRGCPSAIPLPPHSGTLRTQTPPHSLPWMRASSPGRPGTFLLLLLLHACTPLKPRDSQLGTSPACVSAAAAADKGNEEWTEGLATQGLIKEKKSWHPWYVGSSRSMPAGYATTYSVANSDKDFSFVTIRLAGHMVSRRLPFAKCFIWCGVT